MLRTLYQQRKEITKLGWFNAEENRGERRMVLVLETNDLELKSKHFGSWFKIWFLKIDVWHKLVPGCHKTLMSKRDQPNLVWHYYKWLRNKATRQTRGELPISSASWKYEHSDKRSASWSHPLPAILGMVETRHWDHCQTVEQGQIASYKRHGRHRPPIFSRRKVTRNVMRRVNRNCVYTNKQRWDLPAIEGTKDLVQSMFVGGNWTKPLSFVRSQDDSLLGYGKIGGGTNRKSWHGNQVMWIPQVFGL